jgi:hypothetical protein
VRRLRCPHCVRDTTIDEARCIHCHVGLVSMSTSFEDSRSIEGIRGCWQCKICFDLNTNLSKDCNACRSLKNPNYYACMGCTVINKAGELNCFACEEIHWLCGNCESINLVSKGSSCRGCKSAMKDCYRKLYWICESCQKTNFVNGSSKECTNSVCKNRVKPDKGWVCKSCMVYHPNA